MLGVNDEGKPYFYWSETPAEFAAYFGKNKTYWVWGQLEYGKHGKTMTPDSRVFIADRETALKLEKLGVVRPCKICDKSELARYEADQSLQLNPQIEID